MERFASGRPNKIILSSASLHVKNGVVRENGLYDVDQLGEILRRKINQMVVEEVTKCSEKRAVDSELSKIRDSNRQLQVTLTELERRLEAVAGKRRVSSTESTSQADAVRAAASSPSASTSTSGNLSAHTNGQLSGTSEPPFKQPQKRRITFDASYGDQKRFAVHVGPRQSTTAATSNTPGSGAVIASGNLNASTTPRPANKPITIVAQSSGTTRRFLVRTTVNGEDACYKLEVANDAQSRPLTAEAVVRLLIENRTPVGPTADVRELNDTDDEDSAPLRPARRVFGVSVLQQTSSRPVPLLNGTSQPLKNGNSSPETANVFEKVLNNFDGACRTSAPQPSHNVFERLLNSPNGLRRTCLTNGSNHDREGEPDSDSDNSVLELDSNAPPRAVLKLDRRGANEAALTWDLIEFDAATGPSSGGPAKTRYDHTRLSVFEIYACLEDAAFTVSQPKPSPPSCTGGGKWQPLARVPALPLPMACTLSQFQAGRRYYLAIRARDRLDRAGPFSDVVIADFCN